MKSFTVWQKDSYLSSLRNVSLNISIQFMWQSFLISFFLLVVLFFEKTYLVLYQCLHVSAAFTNVYVNTCYLFISIIAANIVIIIIQLLCRLCSYEFVKHGHSHGHGQSHDKTKLKAASFNVSSDKTPRSPILSFFKEKSILDKIYLPSFLYDTSSHSLSPSRLGCSAFEAYSPGRHSPLNISSAPSCPNDSHINSFLLLEPYSPSRAGPLFSAPISPVSDLSPYLPSRHIKSADNTSLREESLNITNDTSFSKFSSSVLSNISAIRPLCSTTYPLVSGYSGMGSMNHDYTCLLKYKYQLGTERPTGKVVQHEHELPTARTDGQQMRTLSVDQVYLTLSLHNYLHCRDDLDRWMKRLRIWLNGTIVNRLVQQIDNVNTLLSEAGLFDIKIGQTSLSGLEQRQSQVSGLRSLLPFLTLCEDQQYLVSRIRTLARCPCLSQFTWNGGDSERWRESSLPTDANILMHLFASYMDMTLPGLPMSVAENKPFTTLYFVKHPGKPQESPTELRILQSSALPPHYQLTTSSEIWEMPHGPKNLFVTLLLFFFYFDQRSGSIRQVRLGESGLNVSWVFDSDHLDVDTLF